MVGRSSHQGVAVFVALCSALLLASCASATYVEPTYYYGYGDSPAYYYTEPTTYGSPAPAVYYYASPPPPPVNPTFPSPAPPPAVYYYASPTPSSYYYYVAPTPSPAPSPYVAPSPTPPTFYYYAAPVPPSPPGYSPAPPTYYYYTAPTPAPTPIPPPVPSPPDVTPTVCPPCPTCNRRRSLQAETMTPAAAAPTTPAHQILPNAPFRNARGTCYCPYDTEWRSWAISLKGCRESLYERCDSDSRLKCSWLDTYFNPGSEKDFMKAHEKDISEYLYQDCPPAAPCSCAALKFDRKDEATSVFACCRDLSIWSQVPHSGLTTKDVDAFCKAGKAGDRVANWVNHMLWHEECSVAQPAYHSAHAAKAAATLAEDAGEDSAFETDSTLSVSDLTESESTSTEEASVWSPAMVGGLVGLCAFVAVLGGIIGWLSAAASASS